jgi:hypothetical protein
MVATAEGRGKGILTRQSRRGPKILSPLTGLICATKSVHGLRPWLLSLAALRLEDNFMHATQRVEASNRFLGAKFVRSNHAFHNLSTR